MKSRDLLFFAFVGVFVLFAIFTLKDAMPEKKEVRIYKLIQKHIPYYLEKRLSGLSIVNKTNGKKEEPSAAVVMKRFDELQKEWGERHLKVDGNRIVVYDDNGVVVDNIELKNEKEKRFVYEFYRLKR